MGSATVDQVVGSATVRGLNQVPDLAGYTVADNAANLVAAITASPAALTNATSVTLLSNEFLSVSQAEALVALANFDGFAGAYRIRDSVSNVLLGNPSTITGAGSITLLDTVANLIGSGGIANVMASFGLAGVNVDVQLFAGSTATAADLAAIDAANGNGTVVISVTDTAAALAALGAATLSTITNITATTAATVAEAAILEAATNTGTTTYSIADTASALGGASAAVLNGAVNLTATTNATVVQATAIEAATNSGTTSYSISDTAAAIAGASAVVRNSATNLATTDAATIVQAAVIEAATNPSSRCSVPT